MAVTKEQRVSAAAVAREAGVSTATVSYVLNDRPGVSVRTRERILEIAERLGLAPLERISELREQTRTLGLVVTDIANPFYTGIAAGVIDEARKHRYQVFLSHTQERQDVLQGTVDTMIERKVDGVILAVLHPDDGEVVRSLRSARTPLVQLSRHIDRVEADFVGIDDDAAATEVMEHMLSHGYTDVATVTGPRNSSASAAREDAFARTARRHGIAYSATRRLRTYLSEDGGLRAVDRLLQSDSLPRALVCGSDAIAMGALARLHQNGVRVPHDVAISGFDGLQAGAAQLVRLTTVEQPRREMARRSVELLLRRIAGAGGSAQTSILRHELRVGSTCGCPTP